MNEKIELVSKVLPDASRFGKKAYVKKVEIGKWFAFDAKSIDQTLVGYGKVVDIKDDCVILEKYFEITSKRPYAAHRWYDYLPFAIK